MKTLLIETEVTPERLALSVAMMREVKAYYEAVAERHIKAGTMTETQVLAKLEPLADALAVVCLAEEAAQKATERKAAAPQVKALAGAMSVAADNAAECGDCRKPRCRFCGKAGERAGVVRDFNGKVTDRLYVCRTEGCRAARIGQPVPLKVF